jgi:hypothetical protein
MKQTRFSTLLTAGAVITLATALSGCSSAFNPIGSNTYDCNRKQDPSSIYCHSFKSVEASTNGELPDSRFDRELKFSQYDKATEIAPVGDGSHTSLKSGSGEAVVTSASGLPHLGGLASAPLDGMPVREGPVIQRTWIKHFVDANDMLTSDTTVSKEIVPTRWAGFDGGDPASAQQGLYPHRTVDTKASAAPKAEPSVSQRTDFIQPGSTTSANESSPGSSMPNSMPQ